jgi:hypothetical protein
LWWCRCHFLIRARCGLITPRWLLADRRWIEENRCKPNEYCAVFDSSLTANRRAACHAVAPEQRTSHFLVRPFLVRGSTESN